MHRVAQDAHFSQISPRMSQEQILKSFMSFLQLTELNNQLERITPLPPADLQEIKKRIEVKEVSQEEEEEDEDEDERHDVEEEKPENNELTINTNIFELLKKAIQNPHSVEIQRELKHHYPWMNNEPEELSYQCNSIDLLMEAADNNDEWHEEFKKLDKSSCKFDKKEEERRRQMAKNREYARKCVQKKKDMRKQAEMRSIHIQRRIQLKKRFTEMKEKNANFAVDLRKTMEEEGVEKLREEYNERKKELNKSFEKLFSADETVNLNFHRLASAREEFEKAAEDLRLKNGVIGTLGSRKIRAKQHMELRQHLYHISVYEHQYRREIKLSELADDYIRNTVPMAAPLVTSIPKDMLDELIRSNRTAELEEFHRFVAENYSTDVKETVDK